MRSLAFLCLLLFPAALAAQSLDDVRAGGPEGVPAPQERLIWKSDLQWRTSPVGLLSANQFVWQQYHEADGSTLYRGTYQQAALDLNLSPAFAEVGPALEFRPMNLFVYRIGYQALYFWGTLGYPLSFDSADADYSEAVIDRLEEEGAEETGLAHRLYFAQTIQAQLGSLVIRNQAQGFAHFFPEQDFEGPYIRERMYDMLQSNFDGMGVNTLAVLWQPWSRGDSARVLLGPYHEVAFAARARTRRHRVGLLFLAIPRDIYARRLYVPRVYIQVGNNLVDQNRQYHWYAQGGFGFNLRGPRAR